MKPAHDPSDRTPKPLRPPAGIALHKEGEALVIAWRWFQPGYVVGAAMFVAAMAWFGWFTWSDFHNHSTQGAIAMALGVGMWPFCVGCLYWMLAGIFDSTILTARPGSVEAKHGPLWWPGGRTRGTDGLVRVAFLRKVYNAQRSRIRTYGIQLEYADKSIRPLFWGIHEGAVADYLVRTLGAYYGVETYTTDDAEHRRQEEAAKEDKDEDDDDQPKRSR